MFCLPATLHLLGHGGEAEVGVMPDPGESLLCLNFWYLIFSCPEQLNRQVGGNLRDLWNLRQLLQFWQLITWTVMPIAVTWQLRVTLMTHKLWVSLEWRAVAILAIFSLVYLLEEVYNAWKWTEWLKLLHYRMIIIGSFCVEYWSRWWVFWK